MSTTSETGFSLLEILVVIALTTLLLSVVMLSPLNHLGRRESAYDVAKAFSAWMQQQQRSSAWSTEPQRMCLSSRQVTMEFFREQRWQQSNTWFALPTGLLIKSEIADSADKNSLSPCFFFTPVGVMPAGTLIFGSEPSSRVSWGKDE